MTDPAKHRRSVAYTKPQIAFLDQEARRLGLTVSEVIRRILDEYREAQFKQRRKKP